MVLRLVLTKSGLGNPQQDLQEKGVIDSGCSRHMTGNMSYLTDIEKIDEDMCTLVGETSGILKSFITGVENLIDQRVKVIRCDNGIEFKNKEMNQFLVKEKAKFDGMADEKESFVGYLINSKAFRVFKSRTRIVKENLHVQFRTKACDDSGQTRIEIVPRKDYILIPFWTADPPFSQSSKSSPNVGFKPSGDDEKKVTKELGKEGGDSSKDSESPVTTKEKVQKKNDVKARSMLLMILPNEHLMTFNQYKDAQTLFAAIQTRFDGNEAIKKTQKTLLKQMYEKFSAPSTESLDSIFNKLQKINKPDLDTMSFDDMYNNFKIIEQEVKGTASSSSSSQNMAFVSSPSSTNKVNTAYGFSTTNTQVSPASTQVSTAINQNGSQLVYEDLEQIHEDDIEEIDLKWQLALLSMRTRRFFQKTGRKITINGSDTVGYDKSKVECFNYLNTAEDLRLPEEDNNCMKIKMYEEIFQDYALWDVIENVNSFKPTARTTTNADGTSTSMIPGPVTTKEKAKKKNDVKPRMVWRNKSDLDTMSIDDLYKNFKIVEHEVKTIVTSSSNSNSSSQNMTFVSSPSSTNKVNTTNVQVSTTNSPISTTDSPDSTANLSDATIYTFLANQPNGSQLVHEDLEQIHEDN
ncbi:hypothetical protein Tco_0936913 [Tanacetum coccineum]|uniref:Uncharacterized protein n=1 Tax=Tanacetum coccineum TaxID=301880 RepID=A0ABQ5DFI0_9ASTR